MSSDIKALPRFLLGATLLFWGVMHGREWQALLLAIIVEGAYFIPLRWEFSHVAVNRSWRIALFIGVMLGALFWLDSEPKLRPLIFQRVFSWSPIILIPIIFVQLYGVLGHMPLSAFRIIQKEKKPDVKEKDVSFHFSNVFYIATFTSGLLGFRSSEWWAIIGSTLLIIWALLSKVDQRKVLITLSLILFAGIGTGIWMITKKIYDDWRSNNTFQSPLPDLTQNTTAIGKLGNIKQNQDIIWRILTSPHQIYVPPYLMTASYNLYDKGIWKKKNLIEGLSRDDQFLDLEVREPLPQKIYHMLKTEHSILDTADSLNSFEIRGHALAKTALPLPVGALSLNGFKVDGLDKNGYNNVRIYPKEAVVSGMILWEKENSSDAPPMPEDLLIPEQEQAAVKQVIQELGIHTDLNEKLKTRAVASWFSQYFQYTKYLTIAAPRLPTKADEKTAVSIFLTENRKGHCEYFASAGVMLLRAMNIPARYAVGFVSKESSDHKHEYYIRGTHAHAWCRYWDSEKKIWRDFDPTPQGWDLMEILKKESWQRQLEDRWQLWREDFLIWRSKPENFTKVIYAMTSLGVIGFLIIARSLWKSRRKKQSSQLSPEDLYFRKLPLWELEKYAIKLLGERQAHQTLSEWLQGLKQYLEQPEILQKALTTYQQLRYDPPLVEASPEYKSIYNHLKNHTYKLKSMILKAIKIKNGSSPYFKDLQIKKHWQRKN